MSRQGKPVEDWKRERIVALLAHTEMTLHQIAERMDVSGSVVSAINKKHGIRDYEGKHSTWRMNVHPIR